MLLLVLAFVAVAFVFSPVCLSRRVRRQEASNVEARRRDADSSVSARLELDDALTHLENTLSRGLLDLARPRN